MTASAFFLFSPKPSVAYFSPTDASNPLQQFRSNSERLSFLRYIELLIRISTISLSFHLHNSHQCTSNPIHSRKSSPTLCQFLEKPPTQKWIVTRLLFWKNWRKKIWIRLFFRVLTYCCRSSWYTKLFGVRSWGNPLLLGVWCSTNEPTDHYYHRHLTIESYRGDLSRFVPGM